MKIKPEHYDHMKSAINLIDRRKIFEHAEQLKNDPRVKDIKVRLLFDIFYAAGLSKYACDCLYSYASDEHILTALKQIQKELHILC